MYPSAALPSPGICSSGAGAQARVTAIAVALLPFCLVCALLATSACDHAPALTSYTFEGPTMGTRYVVKVVTVEREPGWQERLAESITARLDDINQKMSTWLPESEISRFNDKASVEPFLFSAETFEVLQAAQQVSSASDGAFDITVGPLVNAWGFGAAGETPTPPSTEVLAELATHVGFDKLLLDASSKSAAKTDPDLRLDLSAIAKGYAVDQVAAALAGEGFEDYMVEVGGEVRTAGQNPDGTPWRIGIEQPEASPVRQVATVVPLSDVSLATSGNYRNFWVAADGRRISHTLDPRTAAPVEHTAASVSVAHASCMMADAWATALMVLGPERGYEVAVAEDLAVLFLIHGEDDDELEQRLTPTFEALLQGH